MPTSIIQAAIAAMTSLATLLGVVGRKRRLRAEIRDNLALLVALRTADAMKGEWQSIDWLEGRIAIDVARLAGVDLETSPKKPIPWASLVFAIVTGTAFGFWTWYLDQNRFVWYSVFPGIVAFLMAVSILGMTTNRTDPEQVPKDSAAADSTQGGE